MSRKPSITHTEESDARLAQQIHESQSHLGDIPQQGKTRYRGQEPERFKPHTAAQEDADARLAQDLDRKERNYIERLEKDKELARQMQEEEEERKHHGEAFPRPDYHAMHHERYKPITDQEVEKEPAMTDEMFARKLMMEDDGEEEETFYTARDHLPVQPPAKSASKEGFIPCEYCKKVYPIQIISDHQVM